jgi:glutamate transport system permease protein
MSDQTVLYDSLGPIGRRRSRIASLVALAALVALLAWVGRQLNAQDQFAARKWAPLLDPRDEQFAVLWRFLGGGLTSTLLAAVTAICISLVLGVLIAMTRVTAAPWYRWAVVGVVELLRGIPVVIAIFFAARALPELGVALSPVWFVVIGLVVYNSVVIAEIIRAGLNALPQGQREAAVAMGLTNGQTLRIILLPQLVVIVKDTSFGFIVAFEELLRRANVAIQTTRNPVQTLFVIALIYIAINYSLSRLAEYLQRRLARSKSSPFSGGGTAPVPALPLSAAPATVPPR